MYDELILKLREIEAMCETASFEEAANVLKEAADAIESFVSVSQSHQWRDEHELHR